MDQSQVTDCGSEFHSDTCMMVASSPGSPIFFNACIEKDRGAWGGGYNIMMEAKMFYEQMAECVRKHTHIIMDPQSPHPPVNVSVIVVSLLQLYPDRPYHTLI